MKKYTSVPVRSSEITPEHVYLNRRSFMRAAGLTSAAALLAACADGEPRNLAEVYSAQEEIGLVTEDQFDEFGEPINTYDEITNYNNFYEFSLDKAEVARLARNYPTSPWDVQVGGLVHKPTTFSMEDIERKFPTEERIYRLRCVEGWSMVIPWIGFPLAKLLNEVEPMGDAKYVKFTTAMDREQMPGLRMPLYPWPYVEGLRMDEAMNDLTLMVTGLYGNPVPPQNGAPLRLAVPWKYGFKSIKSIVRIDLVEEEPQSLWMLMAPREYGFYANVNPEVNHPRWSQATERRIGEAGRRETLMFNGYADDVASMYSGMDLRQNY
jgi:methionine sulfoxide reductase catalytic subunit